MLEYIAYFFIYGFLGWVLEVAFHGAGFAQWTNRGFLNGAICPIYGAGMVLLIALLGQYENNIFLLFLGGALVCSLLELVTGWILEKVFKLKWWDYSQEKWNIKGYVCLKFSILWGIGAVIALGLIHRGVSQIIEFIPNEILMIAILIMTILFIIDIIATVINLVGFDKDLTSLDEIGDMIKALSDELTTVVYDESVDAKELYDKYKLEAEEKRKELDHLKRMLESKSSEIADKIASRKRKFASVIPVAKLLNHDESFGMVKEKFLKKIHRDKE